ncbi:MAG: linear amide C-N hydrolase [Asgard group archaeon]|nr:linear amide C-N hydrolase [Asgard group archaeon]
MSEGFNIINKKFHHDVVEGTHYEIGKQQAELLKNRNPDVVKWFSKNQIDPKNMGFKDFNELEALYDEYCPGIIDEFQGFSDGLGIDLHELSLFGPPIYKQGNCSQMAVAPSITKNNHVYVGRSYEFNQVEDDFRLITTRIKGKTKTTGFSSFTMGRLDGINNHGFCVSFTGGGTFKTKAKGTGFQFFLITRSMLDNCKTVDEAVKFLKKVPVNGFWNFMVTDKHGNAALAQFFEDDFEIKQISEETKEKMIFSGNHYRLPKMIKYQKFAGDWILKNSTKRCEIIESTLSEAAPDITKETIRKILSNPLYDGVCGYYYSDYFGTLFSIIFDLTDLKADICFGIPTHNKWLHFGFDDPIGVKQYDAILPNKSIKTDTLF